MTSSKLDLLAGLRPEALAAPESGIVEVFNHGRGRHGLLPLWVGEGDMPTPAFICEAATRSLAAGETFYTHQRGIPELREAIARYIGRVYAVALPPGRFFATAGGMQALQIAVRMVAGGGDEVIVPTPAWPNFVGALSVAGARPVQLPLQLRAGSWMLDMARLAAAVTPATRAIVVNTPGNPTGWTATPEELSEILELARAHGLWIIADEIYGRMTYDMARAPSFRDLAGPDEKVMYVQTMSKNWAMTGLRVGWLEAPEALGQTVENLVQYSSSGLPVPLQRAAVAALERGEEFVAHQIGRFRKNRDLLCDALAATGRVDFARPPAAFYLFARVRGHADSRALALRLIEEANVGVAPGTAFGAGGEDHVRICFARNSADMAEAARRLALWLSR